MRVCVIICLAGLAAAIVPGLGAAASKPLRHTLPGSANFPDDSVSIVTESQPAASGHYDNHIAELARAYDAAGLPRVLPVAGLGPIANARDLLRMRGIDLAVLDADVLAYSRLDGTLQGVATRLTQVLKLADKTVYVIAGPDVTSLSELAHQKILALGTDSDSHVTARTLFASLNIDVELGSADLAGANQALASGSAKALVVVAAAGATVLSDLAKDTGLHLVPVPPSGALDAIYTRTTISAGDAPGLAPAGGVPSLQVASLLATYTWQPNVYRYGPVQQFLRALPQAIASLRTDSTADFWQAVDAHAVVPGWPTYAGAAEALAGVAPATAPLPALATAIATAAQPQPVLPATKPPVAKAEPFARGIDLIAHPIAGLADPQSPSGGVFAELIRASLSGEQLRLSWTHDAAAATAKIGGEQGLQLGLGWRRPDCKVPANEALCDRFVFSQPVFQALDVFFVRHGGDFSFLHDSDVAGRSVCAAADADLTSLDEQGRHWLKQDIITLLRRPSLADCLAALEHSDVDAVFGDQMAGQERLELAGFAGRIDVVDRPVAVRDLSAAASKSGPNAAELIGRLDAGLAALKANGQYAEIILSRLQHPPQLAGGAHPVQ